MGDENVFISSMSQPRGPDCIGVGTIIVLAALALFVHLTTLLNPVFGSFADCASHYLARTFPCCGSAASHRITSFDSSSFLLEPACKACYLVLIVASNSELYVATVILFG